MRRRDFMKLIGAATAWPLAAMAQETGRTYRLGCLGPTSRNAPQNVVFLRELGRLGFVEGQNLTVEFRFYGQQVDSVSKFALELVDAGVDMIMAGGDIGIRAAQAATTTIPILGFTDDMVGSGLVNSLARSGSNTTGVSILSTELDGKRQELLIEAVPGLRHIAALSDSNTTGASQLQALQDMAAKSKVKLTIYRVAKSTEIVAAIDEAKAAGATALNVLASPVLFGNRQIILQQVALLGLPAIYQWPRRQKKAVSPDMVRGSFRSTET